MEPLSALLSVLAAVIPPPWGPIIGAIVKVAPLIRAGLEIRAAMQKADPDLLKHIEEAAASAGLSPDLLAKRLFAPHQMTPEEERRWMDRASGWPSGG